MEFRVAALVLPAALLLAACGRSPSRPEAPFSISPSTGGGAEQVFTVVFSDPKGAGNLQTARVLINEYFDGRHACYIYYSRPENAFLLVNDSGVGSTRMKVGDGGELSNSQCRLAGQGSSASLSGNRLKLVLDLWFKPAFKGKKKLFLVSQDMSGKATENLEGGTWIVGAACAPHDLVPPKMSVEPASGNGATQTFTLTYSSGPQDLVDVRALFNRTADGISSCYVVYDVAAETIRLADDESQAFTSAPLKGGQPLENSQCKINTPESSLSESRTAIIWKLAVAFKPAFAGRKHVYLYATLCSQKDMGMQKTGTWDVPYGNP